MIEFLSNVDTFFRSLPSFSSLLFYVISLLFEFFITWRLIIVTIRSQLDLTRSAKPTDPGKSLEPAYRLEYDEKGAPVLVQDGFKRTQELITESLPGTEIVSVVQRYLDGTLNRYAKEKLTYADVSEIPNDLASLSKFSDRLKYLLGSVDAAMREIETLSASQVSTTTKEVKE